MYNRNQKYNKSAKQKSDKIYMNLDIIQLQLFCNFIASDNKNIHKSHIINMNKVISNLDMTKYKNDSEKYNKIEFIKRGIDARLNYNLTKKDLILMHISGGILYNDISTMVDEITNDEIVWVNSIIADALEYGHMYPTIDRMENLCSAIKSGDFTNKKASIEQFKEIVDDIQNFFRQTRSNASSELSFSLQEGVFDEVLREVYDKVTSPSNTLITGCVGINELLGGGFTTGRTYAFLGLPSEGKSITLLDMGLQIKKYNPGYQCKDPTKKPCVVYFTLENSLDETVVRLCEMVGIHGPLSDYSVEELISKLRTEGELFVNSASPIDIIIKYKPGMSVDTSYLYEMTEDLEDDGYEVIAVILDYIKRIRSALDSSDNRVWLGNVINELKVFSELKQVAVITASQLNRDATQHIDESRKANKNDLVRMLGRSQIGESMLILENIDGAFIIAPEWTDDGRKFLGIQRIKNRYKASQLSYLYYPYQGEIKLLEDFNALEPVYKNSMKETPTFTNVASSSPYNEIKELDDSSVKLKKNSENNIFSSLSGSVSQIEDDRPKLKCIVQKITV